MVSLELDIGCQRATVQVACGDLTDAVQDNPWRGLERKFQTGVSSYSCSESWSPHTSASVRRRSTIFLIDKQLQKVAARGEREELRDKVNDGAQHVTVTLQKRTDPIDYDF